MRKNKAIFTLFMIAVITGLLGYTAFAGWGPEHGGSARNINLGLDLEGGVSITYQVVGDRPSAEDMSDTIYKLQQRVQEFSTDSAVFQEGYDRINIEIPGVTDANYVLQQLGRPGSLLFIREHDDEGSPNFMWMGEGFVITRPIEELLETGDVILTGADVASASAVSIEDPHLGRIESAVSLNMTPEGRDAFSIATLNAIQQQPRESIAIFFDGEIISAPTVQAHIQDGQAQITGDFTFAEAEHLASTIRIGGLTLELEELRSNVVGAQLGQEAVATSIIAGAIGIGIVMIFMCVVFLLPGVAASMALLIYAAATLILINLFDFTITMPGIAGIVLGIGMALDANIIIFARIREELDSGISVRPAIRSGFKKALSAIIDGEVTTMIAAIILLFFGSGTVRSFAQTLALSIVLSFITAILVTRLIILSFYGIGFKNKKYYSRKLKPRKQIDFLAKSKTYLFISLGVIIAGFAFMGVNGARGEGVLNFSVEFAGGSSTQVNFHEGFTLSEVENDIVPSIENIIGSSDVQFQMVADSYEIVFRTPLLELNQREGMAVFFGEEFGVYEDRISTENISGTISAEMRRDAVMALLIAVVLMLLYIWIRFKDLRFSGSMVLSVLNDVLFVLVFYGVTRILVGNTFIAVMLTVFGYSSNSTIVIFDRIREGLQHKGKNPDIKAIINSSISATLTRSIYTTISTVVTIAVLYVVGVSAIRAFSLPLIFGIGIGVYTSVCVAPAVLYFTKTKLAGKDEE